MKEISLTRGMVALVDDEVYEWAAEFNWYAMPVKRRFYAARTPWDPLTAKKKMVLLHREIMYFPLRLDVHHIDGDGLNNRRENLRIVTRAQNLQSFQRKILTATSIFRGVRWHTPRCKWTAQIKTGGKQKYLGIFSNEADAAAAYNRAALELFGEFAQLNKI